MTRIAAAVAAVAILFAASPAAAQDASSEATIGFKVPPLIEARAYKIGFDPARVTRPPRKPDYVIHADMVADPDTGVTVVVWLEPGMSKGTGVTAYCKDPCKTDHPPEVEVWKAFREALNEVFLRNPRGFGQFTSSGCASPSSAAWTGLVVESRGRTAVERGLRYRLSSMRSRADAPGTYYHYRVANLERTIVAFKADSEDRKLSDLAAKYVDSLCTPEKREQLKNIMFVAQLDAREVRSQTRAPKAQPMETR